jgi:hypothetical protein
MALNAVMLNNASKQPVPLPEEKQYLRIDGLEAVLHPMSNTTTLNASAKPLKAAGSIYVTSQRVIFVSDAPPSTLAASGNTELVSLSCNLSHFQDGRLVQPWLSRWFRFVIDCMQSADIYACAPHTTILSFLRFLPAFITLTDGQLTCQPTITKPSYCLSPVDGSTAQTI